LQKIILVGKPNVGKSSLFTRLAGRRIAITSDVSGTTRDTNKTIIEIYDKSCVLIDSGGLDDSSELFKNVKAKTLAEARSSDAIIFMVDGKMMPSDEDKALYYALLKLNLPTALVINKIDSKKDELRSYEFANFGAKTSFAISVSHNAGIDELADWIYKQLKDEIRPDTGEDLDEFLENFGDDGEVVREISAREDYERKNIQVGIIGRVNVGKSSILNSLLSYERAIISDEAGTTRDSIEEALKIGTHLVRIIDTAGIRKNAGKIEQIGISYSLRAIEEADVILAVFDASQEADEQDNEILELLKNSQKKIFYVLNKCDLGVKFISPENPIQICAKQGTDEIISNLKAYLDAQETSEILLNSARQISSCEAASEAIKRALNLLAQSELELFAYELNTAIEQISSITKPFERSEILDEMFSSFCLGK